MNKRKASQVKEATDEKTLPKPKKDKSPSPFWSSQRTILAHLQVQVQVKILKSMYS